MRNAREAALALAAGADVVDVKEPTRGGLGRADAQVVQQVVRVAATRRPVTAAAGAWGELAIEPLADWAHTAGAAVIKLGIAGPPNQTALGRLAALRRIAPPGAMLAPVLLADCWGPAPPSVGQVVQLLDALATEWVIIDTNNKNAGNLFAYWRAAPLGQLIRSLQSRGVGVGLAGGLRGPAIDTAHTLAPDVIGVRGAVCDHGRQGNLSPGAIVSLTKQLGQQGVTAGTEKI